jgi:hypothetical protein
MALPAEYGDWVMVGFGAILLLFGSFALRSALTVVGGVLGAAFGLGGGNGFAAFLEMGESWTLGLQIGGMFLGAVAGVLLFRFVEMVAFFMIGSGLTAWGMFGMAPLLERAGVEEPKMVLAAAIPVAATIAGFLGVFYKKLLMGVATAAAGTFLIMNAFEWPWDGLSAIPLFVLGLAFQFGQLRKRFRRKKTEED